MNFYFGLAHPRRWRGDRAFRGLAPPKASTLRFRGQACSMATRPFQSLMLLDVSKSKTLSNFEKSFLFFAMKSYISLLTEKLVAFRDERDWGQFHNPKDLAAALSIEALEFK
jgi:hypothetical protein